MPVMKFGGSSLASAGRIRNAADIVVSSIQENSSLPVVVVSAMKGVTNTLISASRQAEKGTTSYKKALIGMANQHKEAVSSLIGSSERARLLLSEIDGIFQELSDILHGVFLVRECSPRTRDLISGFGERISSKILAAHLSDRNFPAEPVDARDIIRTDNTFGRALVNFEKTEKLVRSRLSNPQSIPVVTGFIASTEDGISTTLGRNGSDYTAGILGGALLTDSVQIWTDVDGILTADPRIVPNARVLDEISFQEAMELSFFGAEVIHPNTLIPVIEKDIPVFIKNTLNPGAAGTRISRSIPPKNRAITGIASIGDVAMVTIEGGIMTGMPGVASQIFSSVAGAGANVIMFTQASSEHSICLICRREEARRAAEVLQKNLAEALRQHIIQDIRLDEEMEIIAVIGENMKGRPGLSGKLFSALGNADVNILAIAQGSTERNISLVVKASSTKDAIQAIHRAFME